MHLVNLGTLGVLLYYKLVVVLAYSLFVLFKRYAKSLKLTKVNQLFKVQVVETFSLLLEGYFEYIMTTNLYLFVSSDVKVDDLHANV